MKKIFTLISVFYLLINFSFAQQKELKVGIRVFPSLAWSRVEPQTYIDGNGNETNFKSQPVKFRGGFGVFGDYYFNDNFAFSTGLTYYFAGSGFLYTIDSVSTTVNTTIKNNYSTQHFQVPLAFKLITNEIADNTKIYISVGVAGDIRTATAINGKSNYQPLTGASKSNNDFTYLLGLNFQVGAGVEYSLKNEMKVLLGFTYSRGLFNTSNNDAFSKLYNNSFSLKNDYVALDLGLKF